MWEDRGEAGVRRADVVHWRGSGSSFSQGEAPRFSAVHVRTAGQRHMTPHGPGEAVWLLLALVSSPRMEVMRAPEPCVTIPPGGSSPLFTLSRHSDRKRSTVSLFVCLFVFPTWSSSAEQRAKGAPHEPQLLASRSHGGDGQITDRKSVV